MALTSNVPIWAGLGDTTTPADSNAAIFVPAVPCNRGENGAFPRKTMRLHAALLPSVFKPVPADLTFPPEMMAPA